MCMLYFVAERLKGDTPFHFISDRSLSVLRETLAKSHEQWEHSRVYELDTDKLDWTPEVAPVPADAVKAVQA